MTQTIVMAVGCALVSCALAQMTPVSIQKNTAGAIVVNSPMLHLNTPNGITASVTGRSGTATLASGSVTVPIGKMMLTDTATVRLVLGCGCAGCGSTQYSLVFTCISNGSTVTATITSSTRGATADGYTSFSDYVTLQAVLLDGQTTAGITASIDGSSLSPDACTTTQPFPYTVSIQSITPFDATWTGGTSGSPIDTTMQASADDVSSLGDVTSTVNQALIAATARITALEAALSTTEAALNRTNTLLAAVVGDVSDLENRTASLGSTSFTCGAPTNLPANTALSWPGGGATAHVGVFGTVQCPAGQYSTSDPIVCTSSGAWSGTVRCSTCPDGCSACTPRIGQAPRCTACNTNRQLVNDHCLAGDGSQANPALSCRNLSTGIQWLRSSSGTAYQAYCLNSNNVNGWGSVYGGGWEIVHTQLGGYVSGSTGVTTTSNNALRASPSNSPLSPPDLRVASTQRSGMTAAWADRSVQGGMQWMKFTAALQGNTLLRQDAFRVDFPSTFGMDWLFQNSVASGCALMPSAVNVTINGQAVGSTNQGVYSQHTRSIGLASPGQDRCSQPNSNLVSGASSTFRRLDGGNPDNAIRHLVTYSSTSTGRDASRCTYCCWNSRCYGKREVIMWGVRPAQ